MRGAHPVCLTAAAVLYWVTEFDVVLFVVVVVAVGAG
jgi:hypothetical protein